MTPESWASYRAAMPPECFGERDDDDPPPPGPTGPPDWYAVEWFAPVVCRDWETGDPAEITAPVGRYFCGDRHGRPEKAARRWARAMADRHGTAWLHEGWYDWPELTGEIKFTRRSEGDGVLDAEVAR